MKRYSPFVYPAGQGHGVAGFAVGIAGAPAAAVPLLPVGVEGGITGKDGAGGHRLSAAGRRVPARKVITGTDGDGQVCQLPVCGDGAGRGHAAAIGVEGHGVLLTHRRCDLAFIAADGTMLVILLRGRLRVPGMVFARIPCAADGADMIVLLGIRVYRQIGVRPGMRGLDHFPAVQVFDGLGASFILKGLLAGAGVILFAALLGAGGRRTGNQNALMDMGNLSLKFTDVALCVQIVVVHMGRLSLFFSTVDTRMPVAACVAVPAVAIRMGMGKIPLIAADVALWVQIVVVGVRRLSVSCSAGGALVPMIECVGFPVGSKVMGVGNLPLITADVALCVLIVVVAVGLRGGFFSAGALLPVAECVGFPAVPKVVGVAS